MDNLDTKRTDLATERTRLAAERTFNSWLRTGLAGVGGGVALIKLLYFHQAEHQLISYIIGKALIVWGLALYLFALFSFKKTSKRLGVPSKELKEVTVITGAVFLFSIILLVLI